MVLSRLGVTLALACAMPLAACTSFSGSDANPARDDGGSALDGGVALDGGACGVSACPPQDHTCRTWFTDTASCPGDWTSAGDTANDSNPIFACSAGKLHVFADGTLDLTAHTSVDVLPTTQAIHVSATVSLKSYLVLGQRIASVLGVAVGKKRISLSASMSPKGNPELYACEGLDPGTCQPGPLTAMPLESHVITFRIATDAVTVGVDCQPRWVLPGMALDSPLVLTFGHADGTPIDATLADVMVSFD